MGQIGQLKGCILYTDVRSGLQETPPPFYIFLLPLQCKNRLYIGVTSWGGVFTAQVERPHNPGHHHDQGTEGAHGCDQLIPPGEGHHDDSGTDNNCGEGDLSTLLHCAIRRSAIGGGGDHRTERDRDRGGGKGRVS